MLHNFMKSFQSASMMALLGAFLWWSSARVAIVFSIISLNIVWIVSRYAIWCAGFAGTRLDRGLVGCPSTARMPYTTGSRGRAVRRCGTTTFGNAPSDPPPNKKTLPMTRATTLLEDDKGGKRRRRLLTRRASGLDMDHVYVSFFDYLWACYFVVPNAVFLWAKGVAVLLLRGALCRFGLIAPKHCDPACVVGRLLLNSVANVVHFVSMEERDGVQVAYFVFLDFKILDMKGELKTYERFWVELDLERKCMIKAKLDNRELTASETIILLWHNNIFAGHVKLHAYANWAINTHASDPFVRQNSVVTAMYNYFGFTVFKDLASFWQFIGAARYNIAGIQEVVLAGVQSGIHSHSIIRKLAPYSSLVDFTVKVRSRFIHEFEKHKADFPGMNGEALFIGTVLHSLDHTLMDDNLEDPLWLDLDHPEFGVIAELGRFVKAGFVSDVPGLAFEKSFKDAPHPFYNKVYHHASFVSQYLADRMDTCIIK